MGDCRLLCSAEAVVGGRDINKDEFAANDDDAEEDDDEGLLEVLLFTKLEPE